jgi:ubiquinone/menaquinone biosynthesis C-methylase UbiE
MNETDLLNKVKNDYNLIAENFSYSRKNLNWPEIEYFKKYLRKNDKVLDLGCGNGRLIGFIKDYQIDYCGLDNSEKLLIQAIKNKPEYQASFILGEMYNLPFVDSQFDIVFCLAAFHHLPTKQLRLKTLSEIQRVLKKDGLLLMTNWYLWQKLFFKNFFTNSLFKKSWNDFFIPWRSGKEKINRYYHGFTKRELDNLFKANHWQVIENDHFPKKSWLKRNWISVLKK